jgi:uncharacterized Zn-binding protein involved in type VI secretion
MGKPAARVGDDHKCPLHGGGPIVPPTAWTVFIGGQKAARISDRALCSPPDVIIQGASTVLIEGLCAARVDDGTAHSGRIASGCPTVLIGGAGFSGRIVQFNTSGSQIQYGTSVFVRPSPTDADYQTKVLQALVRLDSTPTMHKAFDAVERSGHTLTIEPYNNPSDPYNATCRADKYSDSLPKDKSVTFPNGATYAGTGQGTSSTIAWNPDVHAFGPTGTVPDAEAPGSDVILAHEAIHGTHNATATGGNGPVNRDSVQTGEERNTVGLPKQTYTGPAGDPLNKTTLPDTTGQPYTENAVRADYRNNGIVSQATGRPPVSRPSYYTGGGGPF